jgi:hypothetical protein
MKNLIKKMINNKKIKGSVLVFSLLIMFFMLVIALGMAAVTNTETRSSISTVKSTQAFQYADTGAEQVLIVYKNSENQSANLADAPSAGGLGTSCVGDYGTTAFIGTFASEKYEVRFKDKTGAEMDCNDPVGNIRKIKSTGSHLGNTRAIEVDIPCSSPFGPDTGVVGLWHFQEPIGSALQDFSGNGNSGTIFGNTAIDANGICNARSFDGTGDYVRIGGQSSLGTSNQAYAIALWFKANGATNGGVLMHMASTATGGDPGWCLPSIGLTAGRNISVQSWNSGSVSATSPDNTQQNQWYYVVETWAPPTDVNAGLRLYVNGELKATTAMPNYTASNTTNYIFPGAGFASKTCSAGSIVKRDFNGSIDEVRVFNVARSESQIKADFCSGRTRVNPTPALPPGGC